jgi:mediator of RNA polymerase II transcription subunit 16
MLTYLENIDGKSWQLAQPQYIDVEIGHGVSPELTLASWSNMSTDLAVTDIYGNFFIYLAGVGLIEKESSTPGNGTNLTSSSNNNSGSGTGGGSGAASSPDTSSNTSYELTSYNHMEMIYQDIVATAPEMNNGNHVVAFKWLGMSKPQIFNKPAHVSSPNDSNVAYSYSVSQAQPQTISHPISTKQACIAVRKNGQFMLYYQGEHKVEYHKISLQLCDEAVVITKASIGFNNDKRTIVCVHDSLTSKITTYAIDIDWGFLTESAKRQKADPHFHTPKEHQKLPTLTVNKIHEMKIMPTFCKNTVDEIDDDDDKMDVDVESSVEFGSLESIDIISPTLDKKTSLDILFSYILEDTSSRVTTKVYRYSLIEELSFISDAFGDLASRKNIPPPSSPTAKLQSLSLQGKLTRPGRILSIETGQMDQLLFIFYDNGKIDVLNRLELTIINNNSNPAKSLSSSPPSSISTLYDIGYDFPQVDFADQKLLAVSPNMASLVYVNTEDDIPQLLLVEKNKFLELTQRDLYITSVGFAFQHANSCYANFCSDDLIILIQTEVQRIVDTLTKTADYNPNTASAEATVAKFTGSVLSESHKAINFHLDAFSKESVDKLLSNPPLQKLMSLQLALGEFHSTNHVVSDIAWIILNLRSTSFGIMFLLSGIMRQMSKKKVIEDSLQDSITRGESIMSLIGNVKWFIDLMTYIYQELFQLSYYLQDPSNSQLNLQNSIALPLILGKVPRLFLMYTLSSIGKTNETLKKLQKELSDANKLFTPMKEALNRYFIIYNHAPCTLRSFERYLRECDAYITKESNSKQGRTPNDSLSLEEKLVCHGKLTEEMEQIAKTLINRHSLNLAQHTKVSELFFHNVDWLDVGITRHQNSEFNPNGTPILYRFPNLRKTIVPRLQYSEIECIDALRKIIISLEGLAKPESKNKLRKCTRCRSVSLATDPAIFDSTKVIGLWTMVFQRTCICGNSWVKCSDI